MANGPPPTTQSSFEKKIEEQAAATAFQLVWGWIEKLGHRAWEKKAVHTAMKSYAEMYRERHGRVKVLSMSKTVPLHQIYTAVCVIPHNYLCTFIDPDKMHAAFKSAGRQHPAFRADSEDGIVVAQDDEPFLTLLGAAGSGKSTFLRRLGQEALLARKPAERIDRHSDFLSSKYEHALLPVYVELRAFRTKPVDLIALLVEEFTTCGFPESEVFVEAALKNGKLLVLLDGLDEVPNDKLDEVIQHVKDVVDRYGNRKEAGNRFVTSCRTAHYKNAFPRFTDVVLADFGNEQIQQFANNWFTGLDHRQTETGKKFFDTLNEPANSGALELAKDSTATHVPLYHLRILPGIAAKPGHPVPTCLRPAAPRVGRRAKGT